jgi:hypothetical protein
MDPTFKKDLPTEIFDALNDIKAGGGTTIQSGCSLAKEILLKFVVENECVGCENRIILLTDVEDGSFEHQKAFISEAAEKEGINTTVVGISTSFRSNICEKLKYVRGFNYFCAVNEEDIKKYVFETFDFGFFPAAYDIQVQLSSSNVKSLEVFGSPDAEQVSAYNDSFSDERTTFVITKMKSVFPSEVEIHNGTLFTVGGLLLIKLNRKEPQPFFKGEVVLSYRDLRGKLTEERFPLSFEFHPEEQFFSAECLREAIDGYAFTSELRALLAEDKQRSRA